MCGLFGVIGNNVNEQILKDIAGEARKRGPNAYGISWYVDNKLITKKYSEQLNPKTAFQGINTTSLALIGNCRLATSGDYRNIQNNQPIALPDVAISHNGNVKSYLQIAKSLGVELKTQCDSEIICHMLKRLGFEETINRLNKEMPMALLLLQNNKITAFRKGQPLYVLHKAGCFYLCSRKFLNSKLLEEGKAVTFEGGIQDANYNNEAL